MQSRFSRLIWVAPDVTATLDQKLLIAHRLTRRMYERTLDQPSHRVSFHYSGYIANEPILDGQY